ncbi:class I SAM-dependent methyltransferase [Streptomyces sp. NPDC050560]|uniref:class I SAM-dependent methyltransferase n=1 Tax=Streptomyces sp. NPDC050560 TaxID=3365630 RepID=UPI0037B110F8
MDRDVRTMEDVLRLLDGLFAPEADRWTARAGAWWDGFYRDRAQPVPFFVAKPDESLVAYVEKGLVAPGRALELGCGPGRNALYLAGAGFEVDAVDLSPKAVDWARERAAEAGGAGARVRWVCGDAFTAAGLDGPYDLVHDSGCFHHLPPHRRPGYLALLERVLAPGGQLSLACFAAGAMGSELPDADFYRDGRLHGGLAYTPEELRWIFEGFEEVELRRMHEEPVDSPYFGESFLWTALLRRPESPAEGA